MPDLDTEHHDDDHHLGLAADVSTLLARRRVLGLLAGAGVATLAGCTSPSTGSGGASAPTGGTAGTATGASCTAIPGETAGPFPGDGSNGPDVLNRSGIVRSDIRSSFGSASGVAKGVPATIKLTVTDSSKGCAARSGAAVYLWHCDIDGKYSLYANGVTAENYLRGVQETDGSGVVTFRSIFPAAYSGRWPHIHFEVYPSLAKATAAADTLATSQLALPADVCRQVYATDGYSQSVRNLAQTSLDSDNVFSDGYQSQLATVTGDVSAGLVIALAVPV